MPLFEGINEGLRHVRGMSIVSYLAVLHYLLTLIIVAQGQCGVCGLPMAISFLVTNQSYSIGTGPKELRVLTSNVANAGLPAVPRHAPCKRFLGSARAVS